MKTPSNVWIYALTRMSKELRMVKVYIPKRNIPAASQTSETDVRKRVFPSHLPGSFLHLNAVELRVWAARSLSCAASLLGRGRAVALLSSLSPPVCAAEPRRRDESLLWLPFVRIFPSVLSTWWVILAPLEVVLVTWVLGKVTEGILRFKAEI